jgi:NADH dehydrogenase (ubiquinone) 1 beta subcomplex subunit 7
MSDIAPPGKPQRMCEICSSNSAGNAQFYCTGIVYKTEAERAMKVNPDILKREKINIYNRDFCAHFLVPLNRCRRSQPMHVSFPWTCHEELHAYERCQHIE